RGRRRRPRRRRGHRRDRQLGEAAELAATTGSPHLALAAALAAEPTDPDAAVRALQAVAAESPTYLPARMAAARIALAGNDPAAIAGELRALVGALAWADGTAWRCTGCGHRTTQFVWRCPSCRRWSAFAPEVGRHRVTTVVVAPRERRSQPRRPTLEAGAATARSAASSASSAAAIELPLGDATALTTASSATADTAAGTVDLEPAAGRALALPAPALAHGLTSAELARRAARPSVLGKVGGWFSDRFRRR
ncbi:MAG TPA: hypothetical protein VHE35_24620, partial [Kofleriaceae bacterium]|nr:hypothetical protein [Kofleriaceae bacterium]